ncbi:Hypothetical protein NTJ_02906 [Nesidiocoris tenuis]|uniref:PPC89 centrosome localisation domain-containing protein n=1 Tax=Nesidiocoris tenuis TaxID=355587 RepID=A0ABN7ACU8_9HEMI|nr:Hypothetical protein NTJ_02906 [Nesidiocoris tenuis]
MFQRGKDSDENLVLRQCENILLKNMKDSGRHIRQKTLDCRRKKSTCLDSTMGRQGSCQNCKAARIDGDLINKAVDMDVAKHAATCDNKIVGSLEAQLELLRSELTLSRNQVKERNAQLKTLETLVNHQSDVMKHSCEGSTSLSKVVQLIQVAVELQNQQVANIKNIEKRIKLLERPRISQVCLPTCKTLEKRDPCKMQCRLNAPDQGKYQAVTRNEATQYDADPSESRVLITSVDKTVASEELNPKETIDKRLYDEMRSQFEDKEGKLKRMNCQMSDTIKTLEDQIQFLKKKLEKLDEEKSTALESVKRSNEENRTLQQQLTSLTEQNSRSSVNIRKLDEERDKIIKELDSADEEIAKLKNQLRTADERGAGFEAQYKSSAEQNW